MLTLNADITLNNRKLKAILRDSEKSAAAVNLVYVHDNEPGISRIKKGETFIYRSGKKIIKDNASLLRIKN